MLSNNQDSIIKYRKILSHHHYLIFIISNVIIKIFKKWEESSFYLFSFLYSVLYNIKNFYIIQIDCDIPYYDDKSLKKVVQADFEEMELSYTVRTLPLEVYKNSNLASNCFQSNTWIYCNIDFPSSSKNRRSEGHSNEGKKAEKEMEYDLSQYLYLFHHVEDVVFQAIPRFLLISVSLESL